MLSTPNARPPVLHVSRQMKPSRTKHIRIDFVVDVGR